MKGRMDNECLYICLNTRGGKDKRSAQDNMNKLQQATSGSNKCKAGCTKFFIA